MVRTTSPNKLQGVAVEVMNGSSRSPAPSAESNGSCLSSDSDVLPAGPSLLSNGIASVVESLQPDRSQAQPGWSVVSFQPMQKKSGQPQQANRTNFAYPQPPTPSRQRISVGELLTDANSIRNNGFRRVPHQSPSSNEPSSASSMYQDQSTSSPAYLRPMPPLIPVNVVHNFLPLPQKQQQQQQQRLAESSISLSESSLQLTIDSQGTSNRGPPRKSSRFREGAGEGSSESDHSPSSSASSSPPLSMSTDGDQSLRSTSGMGDVS